MKTNLCLHVDGSRVRTKDRSTYAIGWAAVGMFDGELIEHCGAQQLTQHQLIHYGNLFEHVAFAEGVQLAHRLGVPFEQLTLLCDDDIFGYAPTWLHPENYLPGRRDHVLSRLDKTVKGYFEEKTRDLVLSAFDKARIVKLKGHRFEVYQERADYLAKHQGKLTLGLTDKPALSFENWLATGLVRYLDPALPPETWHAPFVRAQEAAEPALC